MATNESTLGGQGAVRGVSTEDVADIVQRFLTNQHVQPEQGVGILLAENSRLREDKRNLKVRAETAEAKVPQAGSIVLVGDDVKKYEALVKILGDKKPEDLATIVKEHGDLTTKVTLLEKETLINKIAEAEDWKPGTLLRLTSGMDLVVEEVTEEIDDPEKEGAKKKVQVSRGFLTVKDAAGNVTGKKALAEELKDFLPSLVKEPGEGSDAEGASSAGNGAQGTPFVRQSSGATGVKSKQSISKNFLSKRYGTAEKN